MIELKDILRSKSALSFKSLFISPHDFVTKNEMGFFHSIGEVIKIFKSNGDKILTKSLEQAENEYVLGATVYLISSKKAELFAKYYLKEGRWRVNEIDLKPDIKYSAFFSKAGTRMPLHWDSLHNLTIQIGGVKKWRFGENYDIKNANFNYAYKISKNNTNVEISTPNELNETTMYPGDALYLPRGYWHETETLEDSVSISVNIKPYTVIDSIISEVDKTAEFFLLRQCLLESLTLNKDEQLEVLSTIKLILNRLVVK